MPRSAARGGWAKGEPNPDRGPSPHNAIDSNRSIVLVDDPLGDGETETGAAGIAAVRGVGPLEAVEDMR